MSLHPSTNSHNKLSIEGKQHYIFTYDFDLSFELF